MWKIVYFDIKYQKSMFLIFAALPFIYLSIIIHENKSPYLD